MLTLAQMVGQIKRHKLSPVTLLKSILQRIDSLEPSLKAWVTIDRQSIRKEAQRCKDEIKRGRWLGPLHGIPIGVKDIFLTAGLKTTLGSKIFSAFIPPKDATVVDRLKKSGAIILGKTATTEFASLDPAPTRNPWNLDHTPGGSSSGSAVAVATGMCPAALGSQTAGSVLRPAAYCGVVGFKPTYGRISRQGLFPLSWTLDHVGFMTRSVKDAAILLQILAGGDPQDPTSSQRPVPDYVHFLRPLPKRPKIGVVKTFFKKNAAKEIWQHTEETIQKLAQAGARVELVNLPAIFQYVHPALKIITRVEVAAFHERLFAMHSEQYAPKVRERIETGFLIPGVDYLQAQRIKRQFRREMEEVLQPYDCLLTPSTPSAAPPGIASTGSPSFQVPWTFSGLPAITIPSGLNREKLPLGIQLIGRAFSEEKLLATASWCEEEMKIVPYPSIGSRRIGHARGNHWYPSAC